MIAGTADLRAKSVYEPAEAWDGRRVLVTRYWPRGVSRARVDDYVRPLAPSRDLLAAFKQGAISWDQFRIRYLKEMEEAGARAHIQRLSESASRSIVTLLCACKSSVRCHTTPLRDLIAAKTEENSHDNS